MTKRIFFFVLVLLTHIQADPGIVADRLIIYPEHQGKKAQDILLEYIHKARCAIQIAAYQIKDPALTQALIQKAKAGVKIDILIEPTPYLHSFNQSPAHHALAQLTEAGINIHEGPEYLKALHPTGHNHAKYIIVDGEHFILSTGNFDESTFDHCRDFAVVLNVRQHPEELSLLRELFVRDMRNQGYDWNTVCPKSIVVGPDGQREKVIQFLKEAKSSVKIYQQYCNDTAVIEAIEYLVQKGVKVTLLMMPYPTNYENDSNTAAQDRLKEAGVNVGLIVGQNYIHARLIIVDDAQAWVGTMQLSEPSLDNNRELSFFIEGPTVKELVTQFEEDQKLAQTDLARARNEALQKRVDWNKVNLTKQ